MRVNSIISKWFFNILITSIFCGLPVTGSAGSVAVSETTSGDGIAKEMSCFSLSPQRIKLGMLGMPNATPGYKKCLPSKASTAPAASERAIGAAQAMRRISENASLWASGFYNQGKMNAMYGTSASVDKHYGIVMGGHYYHLPSKQLFGIAFNIGLGDSKTRRDHDLKNIFHSNQATLYYGLGLAEDWKLNVQGAFMRIEGSHHRPYTNNGKRSVAVSHSRTHIASGMVEVSHKYKPSQNVHVKSSFGGIYVRSKQFSHKEQNVGTNAKAFPTSTMNEAGIKVGIKGSFFLESDDKKTYGVYPQVSYTRFVKRGTPEQRAVALKSGQAQLTKSGTAGKDLLSIGIGVGIINKENSSKAQIGYTANFQKSRKSHEVMVKYSVAF
jgi:hypothetical protein